MLESIKKVFIIGIKGVAMANIAIILKKLGKNVSGSDTEETQITDDLLKKNNISCLSGFKPEDLSSDTDLVIFAASHQGEENPQVKKAKDLGIKTITQAQFLGEFIDNFKTKLAVCGCHGKTTTSSLLSYALMKLNAGPSYLVGAPGFNNYAGGDYLKSDFFVIEADEYGVNPPSDKTPKFLALNPDYILCTNIDFDHPDVYENLEKVKKAFSAFLKKLQNGEKKIIVCRDDEDLMSVMSDFPKSSYLSYGFSQESDLRVEKTETSETETTFNLSLSGKSLGSFEIGLFGEKNALNAAGVILLLSQLGFSPDDVRNSIKDFSGTKRRFEELAFSNNVYLFDDYAHHPREIEATIKATRERFKGRRVGIIFQPHTYSRTSSLLLDFAHSLSLADYSLIAPIFPSAREKKEDFLVSSLDIQKKSFGNVKGYGSKEELVEDSKNFIQKGDVVFLMGAGDIYKLENDIIEVIKRL